jgi:hypothetical protein
VSEITWAVVQHPAGWPPAKQKKAAPGGGHKVALKEPQGNKTASQRKNRADAASVAARHDSGVTNGRPCTAEKIPCGGSFFAQTAEMTEMAGNQRRNPMVQGASTALPQLVHTIRRVSWCLSTVCPEV